MESIEKIENKRLETGVGYGTLSSNREEILSMSKNGRRKCYNA